MQGLQEWNSSTPITAESLKGINEEIRKKVDKSAAEVTGNLTVAGEIKEQGARVYSPNNKPTPEAIGALSASQKNGVIAAEGLAADAAGRTGGWEYGMYFNVDGVTKAQVGAFGSQKDFHYLFLGKGYDDRKALLWYPDGSLRCNGKQIVDGNQYVYDSGNRVYSKNYSPMTSYAENGPNMAVLPGLHFLWVQEQGATASFEANNSQRFQFNSAMIWIQTNGYGFIRNIGSGGENQYFIASNPKIVSPTMMVERFYFRGNM